MKKPIHKNEKALSKSFPEFPSEKVTPGKEQVLSCWQMLQTLLEHALPPPSSDTTPKRNNG